MFYSIFVIRRINTSIIVRNYLLLSNDVASGSEITPCIEIDKPLVVYRFSGKPYAMTHMAKA